MNGGNSAARYSVPRVRFRTIPLAGFDAVYRFRRFEDRQPNIERVTIEDSREALGNHCRRARRLDCNRGYLAARAATEVRIGYDNVAGFHASNVFRIEPFQRVLAQLDLIDDVAVFARNNHVCVDVLAVFMRESAQGRFHYAVASSMTRGSVILPVSAEAAQVAGEAR